MDATDKVKDFYKDKSEYAEEAITNELIALADQVKDFLESQGFDSELAESVIEDLPANDKFHWMLIERETRQ